MILPLTHASICAWDFDVISISIRSLYDDLIRDSIPTVTNYSIKKQLVDGGADASTNFVVH